MSSLVSGSSAPGPMMALMLSHVRFSVAGSCAIAFQKLLIQSVLRVAMMSSYMARTSGLASLYSINPNVDIALSWLVSVFATAQHFELSGPLEISRNRTREPAEATLAPTVA